MLESIWELFKLFCGIVAALFFGIVLAFFALFAVLIGAAFAVRDYFLAANEKINLREWDWEEDDEPARRSYFFGPGYAQLVSTFNQSFENNRKTVEWFKDVTEEHVSWIDWDDYKETMETILAYAFRFAGAASIRMFGAAFTVGAAWIHSIIITAARVCIYMVYSIVWLIDIVYLAVGQIRSICPNCKERFIVPFFVCPRCGIVHKHLTPGPYGIFYHTCKCGMRLPSTFMNGRSALESHCPFCNTKLASSDTIPFILQMAGGTSVGKTVYIAALYHWFAQSLKNRSEIRWEIPKDFIPYFQELERYYEGAVSENSVCENSQLYPMIISTENKKKYMLSVFDIAGEMFDESISENVIQQKHFRYCNGFLLILDPFCRGSSLEASDMEEKGFYSEMTFEEVVNAFINYLLEITRTSVGTKIRTPLSVIIAKCDVEEISARLSEDAVTKLMSAEGNKKMNRDEARDQICREFICDIGFFNEVEILEQNFSSIHYFPVSAMGHKQDGTEFKPYGVVKPVKWIMEKENHDLLSLFTS